MDEMTTGRTFVDAGAHAYRSGAPADVPTSSRRLRRAWLVGWERARSAAYAERIGLGGTTTLVGEPPDPPIDDRERTDDDRLREQVTRNAIQGIKDWRP